jgi:hypothetical protein
MRYFDYDWDLYHDRIILDKELNTVGLGWKHGDHFKLVIDEQGRQQLVKVDPIILFAEGYEFE